MDTATTRPKDNSTSPFLAATTAAVDQDKSKETPTSPPPDTVPTPPRHLPFFPCCTTATATVLLFLATAALLLATAALTVFLTALKQHHPTITLASVSLTSNSPSITLTPGGTLLLNGTLHFDLLLVNPNRAAFHHSTGSILLFYRGSQVGSAQLAPGTVPGRGSEHAACSVKVETEGLAKEMGNVVKEIQKGELGIETRSRIEGRVLALGFIRRKVSSQANCYVVVGIGPVRVLRYDCSTAPAGS